MDVCFLVLWTLESVNIWRLSYKSTIRIRKIACKVNVFGTCLGMSDNQLTTLINKHSETKILTM